MAFFTGLHKSFLHDSWAVADLGVGVNRIEVGSSDGIPEAYASISGATS